MRLILILFFGSFLICSLAEAKVITLSNCSESDSLKEKKPMTIDYIKNEFVIDTDKKVAVHNIIFTDNFVKERSEFISKSIGRPYSVEKISTYEYKINYSDNKFIKLSRKAGERSEETAVVDLNEKIITRIKVIKDFLENTHDVEDYIYCGGNGATSFLKKTLGQ